MKAKAGGASGSAADSAMYLLLLVFGAMLCAAGVVLAGAGISVHDRTFDASLVTPGVVAVVGGCLVLGLGFALRVLRQIERAIALRPTPRARRPGESAEFAAPETSSAGSHIALPVKIARLPQTAAAGAPAASAPAKHAEELPQKFPSVVRGPAAQSSVEPPNEADESSVPPLFARRSGNGTASAGPRLDVNPRSPIVGERSKSRAFDALWPRAPRTAPTAGQTAPAQAPAPPEAGAPAAEPKSNEAALDASPTTAPEEAPLPISILKSGVVDGMAYTLYSDGSIEAQLPQGTLRFGSIAELRAHIEQDSQN
jgi:hypothetical protein